jgi:hypothetical protein
VVGDNIQRRASRQQQAAKYRWQRNQKMKSIINENNGK